jgi:CheY-specific phosphatase CheX
LRIDDWDELHAMVVEAGEELFASNDLPSTYAGATPHRSVRWAETLSIIGLGGSLRGTLVLSVPGALVRRSHPTGGTSADDLADWLAELANLLLGGIKIRLLARGVAIELSTPLAISATAFRVERFVGTPVVHSFTAPGEAICVVFEAVSPQNADFLIERRPAAVNVGGMITF